MTLLTHPQLDFGLRPQPGRMFIRIDTEKTSSGGVILPDISVSPTTQGVIEAVGTIEHADFVGQRVALVPATGAMLAVCNPNLQLPHDMLEIDEGDVLATWDGDDFCVYPDLLPADSIARRWVPIPNHVLMRPYSPVYAKKSGLIAWKNEKWPKIWGHLLCVPFDLLQTVPDAAPGALVVYSRYSDDLLGYDKRVDGAADLPVVVVSIEEVKLVIDPAPVTLEVN